MSPPQLSLPLAPFKFVYERADGGEVTVAFRGESIRLSRYGKGDSAVIGDMPHWFEFDTQEARFVADTLTKMSELIPEWIKQRDKQDESSA